MNTPAHLLLNLAVLDRSRAAGRGVAGGSPAAGRWIAAGALLPDFPMLVFYVWQRGVVAAPERHIWGHAYFEPAWQTFFDLFHSIPVFALIGALAWALGRAAVSWGCASVVLHAAVDALLHREDGHRHLWPLSDARFMSPVSYWDSDHHGWLGAGLEVVVVIASTALLWHRAGRGARIALAVLCLLWVGVWTAFYARA